MASFSTKEPICVIYGEEEFFLDRELQKIRDKSGYSIIQVDGYDVDDSDFLSILEDQPYQETQRVIILDNAQKLKVNKILKSYLQDISPSNLSYLLRIIVRDAKLPAVWSDLAKKGKSDCFEKLKTWENRNEVVAWIREEGKRLSLSVDETTAKEIFQVVGTNLYRLSNELKKLSVLLGPKGTVTRESWSKTLSFSATVEPWEVAEWAADKRSLKALVGVSTLYRTSTEDPAVPVCYALMKQAERLLVARSLLDQGASEEDIAIRFGMNPWRCKNTVIPMAKKHTAAKLVEIMQSLCELDINMKTKSSSKRTYLELAILAFSTP